MQRCLSQPRPNWQQIVESQGLSYHSPDDQPYWDESAYYRFTAAEIDVLEKATYALNDMCLAAVQRVIDENLFPRFCIPPAVAAYVANSWDRDELTIYGRFDLAYDGQNPPRLLEYNADTPTSLLESAVIQWQWMKDLFPNLDQFNSIHERLIEAWGVARTTMPGPMYFTSLSGNMEDFMNLTYLRDTAMQGGLRTDYLPIESIGWNWNRGQFVDQNEVQLVNCFKLYPWEWMLKEPFGPQLLVDNTRWFEPPWKMILSNKVILTVLYEMFPQSPYLLPASMEAMAGDYIRKPMLGREGANMQIVAAGNVALETDGIYGGPYVYQKLHPMKQFEGNYPVIGSWMVNGFACGIGIREDASPVTQNASRFVPHVFA
jgi:glutathionylspermidine synthase